LMAEIEKKKKEGANQNQHKRITSKEVEKSQPRDVSTEKKTAAPLSHRVSRPKTSVSPLRKSLLPKEGEKPPKSAKKKQLDTSATRVSTRPSADPLDLIIDQIVSQDSKQKDNTNSTLCLLELLTILNKQGFKLKTLPEA